MTYMRRGTPLQPQRPFSLPPEVRQRIQSFRLPGDGFRKFKSAVHMVMKLLALRKSWAETGKWLNSPHIKDLTEHLVRRNGRLRHTGLRGSDNPVAPRERVSFVRISKWTPTSLRY